MSKEYIMNTYGRFDITFDEGEGSYLTDINGKKYLDFVAGIAVNCLGHCNPEITKTIEEQSKKLLHISNLYWNTNQNNLAKELAKYSGLDQTFFVNSGTEANETAIKLARKYGYQKEKRTVVYMKNSFHGRSMGALSITGQEKYQEKFRPLIGDVREAIFNDVQSLENTIDKDVCAVFIEPIQGEGGILKADIAFLKKAKELCEKHDALLVFDEVQCGIGRTGEMFAFNKYGVAPDVVTIAKGLGGGFPIGAVVANEKAAKAFEPGDHGCTFGGNALGCSVALTVLKEIGETNLLEEVKFKGNYLKDKLVELQKKYSIIEEIRGDGLMLGIKLKSNAKDIVNESIEKGLLLVGAGEQIIRLVPPLTVSGDEIDQAIKIITEVLKEKYTN